MSQKLCYFVYHILCVIIYLQIDQIKSKLLQSVNSSMFSKIKIHPWPVRIFDLYIWSSPGSREIMFRETATNAAFTLERAIFYERLD